MPLAEPAPVRLPEAEQLLRAFLDAVADALPRTPAAQAAMRRGGLDRSGAAAGSPPAQLGGGGRRRAG